MQVTSARRRQRPAFVQPTAVLRYLADLAATTAANGNGGLPEGVTPETLDLTRTGEPADWIGTSIIMPLRPPAGGPQPPDILQSAGSRSVPAVRHSTVARHLAALDALQPNVRLLRLGWVTVAGRVSYAGRDRTICLPLLAQPVHLPGGAFDPDVAARLEAGAQYGGGTLVEDGGSGPETAALLARLPRLQRWIRDVVAAAGLPPLRAVLPPSENPLKHRTGEGLVAVVGAILYVARDQFRPRVDVSLRVWAGRDDLGDTAFAHLYDMTGVPTGRDPSTPRPGGWRPPRGRRARAG